MNMDIYITVLRFTRLYLVFDPCDISLLPPINTVWKISHRYSWYKWLTRLNVWAGLVAVVHLSKFTGFLECKNN